MNDNQHYNQQSGNVLQFGTAELRKFQPHYTTEEKRTALVKKKKSSPVHKKSNLMDKALFKQHESSVRHLRG